MYASRAPEELIGRYAGPYERWVYSEELGRPYAFPAIRLPNAQHVVAILEGPVGPYGIDGPDIRLPPLWPSAAADHAVTPIAFRDRSVGSGATTVEPDRVIARCLSQFAGTGGAPRIRVNLPVSESPLYDAKGRALMRGRKTLSPRLARPKAASSSGRALT